MDNNDSSGKSSTTSDVCSSQSVKEESREQPKPPFVGFGILCCILASIFYLLSALVVKFVKSVGVMEVVLARCWVQFMLMLPYVFYNWTNKGVDFIGDLKTLVLFWMRAFTGLCATFLFYQSLLYLPLGDAITLAFLSVTFSQLLGCLFLHERSSLLDYLLSVFIICGVVLIAKPPFLFNQSETYSSDKLIGIILVVAHSFLAAGMYILIRKLSTSSHGSLNVFYYGFVGLIVVPIFSKTMGVFQLPCSSDLIFLLLVGLLGGLGQVLLTIGLVYETAATFAMLDSFQIVFGFVFQIVVLDEPLSYLSLGGAFLVLISIMGMTAQKVCQENINQSSNRFKCLFQH
uniref:solute carrier family 35 member G1-like n=1 Tax=Ciona intestinalis TaxID=7719 RepID=UPI000180C589|nr:solute carrier family 35 member G1-like [Ciona intestinalis]|eukprot:XP_026690491.1 solute carrier family 35 member G1-like [Ciona intestinalis]